MKTIIEFLYDPNTESLPVVDLINQIEEQSHDNPEMLQMYKFIIRGLEFLEIHGLDHSLNDYFSTTREDGRPYTIKLLKRLENHVPLVEFRVNWVGIGAFRAVFFEFQHQGNQILVFPRAVIKTTTIDPDFEKVVREAEASYIDFMADPEKYIDFTGGVKDAKE